MSIYTQNQSKNKIVSIDGYNIGSFTCYNADAPAGEGVNIQLTSLEEMWYGHEENIDHPEGSGLVSTSETMTAFYMHQPTLVKTSKVA